MITVINEAWKHYLAKGSHQLLKSCNSISQFFFPNLVDQYQATLINAIN